MRTAIAIWHTGNKGKTETIREFANLLLTTYPSYTLISPTPLSIPAKGDFRLILEIKGRIVGVESKGDPDTNLHDRLLDLADNFNCEIILCSTRTRGDTVDAVTNLASTRGFQIIWTSTYEIADKARYSFMNNLKARHILELLQRLSLI